MTNSEKIRSMNDKELAAWLEKISNRETEEFEGLGCYDCVYYGTHHYPSDCGHCEWKFGILEWLKSKSQ